jgi:hypothetical protein
MSVLLPCLLAAAFWYVRAETRRERSFFLLGTILLLLMLTMVHMREAVQFAAYMGCFTLVATLVGPLRPYVLRGAGLLGATLAIAAIYTLWQGWMVPLVDNIVDTQRAELLALAAQHSLPELLLTPASSIFPDSLQKFDQIFITLLPVFLFGGPVVIVVFHRQPLVWLLAATIVAYLLVMSVPLLAIPYIYLTYFEILHLPVRNIVFFVYLLGGALLYITVVALARVDRTRLSPLVVGALGGGVAILVTLCINRSHVGFFLPLIAAYGLTFLFAGGAQGAGARGRGRTAAAVVVSAIALAALWPDHAPEPRSEQVTIRWRPQVTTEQRTALEKRLSLQRPQARTDTDETNVWNYRLTDLTVGNVRRIVSEPAVADTHFIDRSTFEVESQPPLGDYLPLGVLHVRWVQYPNVLVLALMAVMVWAIAFVVPGLIGLAGTAPARSLETALHEPFVRYGFAFALFLMPFALWSVYPTVSTLRTALMRERQWDTPRTMIAGLPCVRAPRMEARFTEHLFEDEQIILPERTTCAPPYEVVQWMQDNLPADGVIGIDRWDPYPPVMFSPQQAVVFPTLEASFIREDTLFDEYYRLFYARMRQYRVQPFFNTEETHEQRDEYVAALGVTHVLVNPAHYDSLRPVLDALPERFALKHAYDRWAIYEVIRS